MKKKNSLTSTMILCLLVILVSSCSKNDETKSDIVIDKISFNGIGDFDYKDSLTYAAVDTIIYKVKIITTPSNAKIFYKIKNSDFVG